MLPIGPLASACLYLTAATLAAWDVAAARKRRQNRLQADADVTDECVGEGAAAAARSKQSWPGASAVARRAVVACVVAGATACAVLHVANGKRRSIQGSKRSSSKKAPSEGGLRIPLKDVVRFREKSWFIEELESARDGDPNSMLRLAKMYLYGQGCERNVNIAVEWLRKARAMGVPCSLDELLTAEDLAQYKAEASRGAGGGRAARAGPGPGALRAGALTLSLRARAAPAAAAGVRP